MVLTCGRGVQGVPAARWLWLPSRLRLTRAAILAADTDVIHVPAQVWPELSDKRRAAPSSGFYYVPIPELTRD